MTTTLLLVSGAAALWLAWCFGKVLFEYFLNSRDPAHGKASGTITWDKINRLFYEKFPHLRLIICERCQRGYRDFERCHGCGHSRREQLSLDATVTFPGSSKK